MLRLSKNAYRLLPQAMSPMTFPLQRTGERALQAVEVVAARRQGDASGGGLRPYTFTFCLERVDKGPYKVNVT